MRRLTCYHGGVINLGIYKAFGSWWRERAARHGAPPAPPLAANSQALGPRGRLRSARWFGMDPNSGECEILLCATLHGVVSSLWGLRCLAMTRACGENGDTRWVWFVRLWQGENNGKESGAT